MIRYDDIQSKLSRADFHLRAYENSLAQFAEANPPVVQSEGNRPPFIVAPRDTPLELALSASDAAHNIRSELDWIAAMMIERGSGSPAGPRQGLPIADRPGSQAAFFEQRLSGAEPRFISFIKQYSPCADHQNGSFCHLNAFVNYEKHRGPSPVVYYIGAFIITYEKDGRRELSVRVGWPVEERRGQRVATLRGIDRVIAAEFEYEWGWPIADGRWRRLQAVLRLAEADAWTLLRRVEDNQF